MFVQKNRHNTKSLKQETFEQDLDLDLAILLYK